MKTEEMNELATKNGFAGAQVLEFPPIGCVLVTLRGHQGDAPQATKAAGEFAKAAGLRRATMRTFPTVGGVDVVIDAEAPKTQAEPKAEKGK